MTRFLILACLTWMAAAPALADPDVDWSRQNAMEMLDEVALALAEDLEPAELAEAVEVLAERAGVEPPSGLAPRGEDVVDAPDQGAQQIASVAALE